MTASHSSSPDPGDQRFTYVLDTSVLLSDPWAMSRFAEHAVVLPLVVINELEGKRHHPELGWFAREALRLLDDLRKHHGRLDAPIPVGTSGGTLHVELNHSDPTVLPSGFRTDTNDARILACALNMAAHTPNVTLITKDMPLRIKAASVGLLVDEYRAHEVTPSGWTGMVDIEVNAEVLDTLYREGSADLAEFGVTSPGDFPTNTGLRLQSASASALGRITKDKQVQLVRGDREAFGLHGRSAEQRVALDLLLDPEVGIISLGGRAGTGKSALALCAGLEAVMERNLHRQGRRVPARVRGGWPGSRLPAGVGEREDGAMGAGRLRHARCVGQPTGDRRGPRPGDAGGPAPDTHSRTVTP